MGCFTQEPFLRFALLRKRFLDSQSVSSRALETSVCDREYTCELNVALYTYVAQALTKSKVLVSVRQFCLWAVTQSHLSRMILLVRQAES